MNTNTIYEVVKTTLKNRASRRPEIYSKINIPLEALRITEEFPSFINDNPGMIDWLVNAFSVLEAKNA